MHECMVCMVCMVCIEVCIGYYIPKREAYIGCMVYECRVYGMH
jgi:hypothetical protein